MLSLELVLAFLRLLTVALQQARVDEIIITSFVRSPEANAAAGGVPNSLHLRGLAIDLAGDLAGLRRSAEIWRTAGLDAVVYDGHVHFELDGPLLRAR